jgi:hypothetical protein
MSPCSAPQFSQFFPYDPLAPQEAQLRLARGKDSSVNALTLLDCFAQLLPMQLEAPLDELISLFDAHLK